MPTIEEHRKRLRKWKYEDGLTYEQIQARPPYDVCTLPELWRIVKKDDYEPQDVEVRRALGLIRERTRFFADVSPRQKEVLERYAELYGGPSAMVRAIADWLEDGERTSEQIPF